MSVSKQVIRSIISNDEKNNPRRCPPFEELSPQHQITFFQFYLTKGLTYTENLILIKSHALFWLLQNVLDDFLGDYFLEDYIPNLVADMGLMVVTLSWYRLLFNINMILDEEETHIVHKYDNVEIM